MQYFKLNAVLLPGGSVSSEASLRETHLLLQCWFVRFRSGSVQTWKDVCCIHHVLQRIVSFFVWMLLITVQLFKGMTNSSLVRVIDPPPREWRWNQIYKPGPLIQLVLCECVSSMMIRVFFHLSPSGKMQVNTLSLIDIIWLRQHIFYRFALNCCSD